MTATPSSEKITISDFDAIKGISSKFARMGDDYLVARIDIGLQNGFGKEFDSLRPGGIVIGLILKGTAKIGLNTETYQVKAPAVVLGGGRSLVKFIESETKRFDTYVLFLSESFLAGINMDINTIQQAHFSHQPLPVTELSKVDAALVAHHMDLLYETALLNPADNLYSHSIARSLTAALMYQFMQINDRKYTGMESHHNRMDVSVKIPGPGRSTSYVTDFIKLLHANFMKERSVAFYAEQLCISPKYLSSVLKKYTRRSPGEWIDEYVILEAKNMLRFSGLSIQEVAYAMNFKSQSSFGKYFKNATGMSPTEFQKN
ncbi:MAG: helix-turn-helix domain-containing protein [Muribaculaceae bacterium]|nr:helix-turn-helix domain-containing protein [Muribaculaceae bacterium]MDE6352510.1 helix-turn-helix domain-containing protein [Muribaculaceae bacterium]MDE6643143.1 helix-turn-helix domain-containing protein [Muribaculaceae bacterium]